MKRTIFVSVNIHSTISCYLSTLSKPRLYNGISLYPISARRITNKMFSFTIINISSFTLTHPHIYYPEILVATHHKTFYNSTLCYKTIKSHKGSGENE